MPDGCGESQNALSDPRADPRDGAPSVAFEIEVGFEGLVDRLDDLT